MDNWLQNVGKSLRRGRNAFQGTLATTDYLLACAASGTEDVGRVAISTVADLVQDRTSQQRIFGGYSKVGGTAGWTVGGGAVNTGLTATMAASQTAGTLVVPITGLKVGDTITAFSVVGQIESAGGTVTLDADLRKLTAAAADPTDASLGTITQISVTADAIISASKTLETPEVVAAGETFYVLLTGTTGASTDIALMGVTITVTET
jgi:hypothetical protein